MDFEESWTPSEAQALRQALFTYKLNRACHQFGERPDVLIDELGEQGILSASFSVDWYRIAAAVQGKTARRCHQKSKDILTGAGDLEISSAPEEAKAPELRTQVDGPTFSVRTTQDLEAVNLNIALWQELVTERDKALTRIIDLELKLNRRGRRVSQLENTVEGLSTKLFASSRRVVELEEELAALKRLGDNRAAERSLSISIDSTTRQHINRLAALQEALNCLRLELQRDRQISQERETRLLERIEWLVRARPGVHLMDVKDCGNLHGSQAADSEPVAQRPAKLTAPSLPSTVWVNYVATLSGSKPEGFARSDDPPVAPHPIHPSLGAEGAYLLPDPSSPSRSHWTPDVDGLPTNPEAARLDTMMDPGTLASSSNDKGNHPGRFVLSGSRRSSFRCSGTGSHDAEDALSNSAMAGIAPAPLKLEQSSGNAVHVNQPKVCPETPVAALSDATDLPEIPKVTLQELLQRSDASSVGDGGFPMGPLSTSRQTSTSLITRLRRETMHNGNMMSQSVLPTDKLNGSRQRKSPECNRDYGYQSLRVMSNTSALSKAYSSLSRRAGSVITSGVGTPLQGSFCWLQQQGDSSELESS